MTGFIVNLSSCTLCKIKLSKIFLKGFYHFFHEFDFIPDCYKQKSCEYVNMVFRNNDINWDNQNSPNQ